jgi:hypothetical protein
MVGRLLDVTIGGLQIGRALRPQLPRWKTWGTVGRTTLDRTTEPRDATLRSPHKEENEGLAEIGPADRDLLGYRGYRSHLLPCLSASGRPGPGTDRTAWRIRMSNLSGARRQRRLLTGGLIFSERAVAPLGNVSCATIVARIEWMLYGDDLDRPLRAAVLERHYRAAHCTASRVDSS